MLYTLLMSLTRKIMQDPNKIHQQWGAEWEQRPPRRIRNTQLPVCAHCSFELFRACYQRLHFEVHTNTLCFLTCLCQHVPWSWRRGIGNRDGSSKSSGGTDCPRDCIETLISFCVHGISFSWRYPAWLWTFFPSSGRNKVLTLEGYLPSQQVRPCPRIAAPTPVSLLASLRGDTAGAEEIDMHDTWWRN